MAIERNIKNRVEGVESKCYQKMPSSWNKNIWISIHQKAIKNYKNYFKKYLKTKVNNSKEENEINFQIEN